MMMKKSGEMMKKHNLVIFVSGGGTNCENIIRYFVSHPSVTVQLVVSSNAKAGALERVRPYAVPTYIANKEILASSQFVNMLRFEYQIDFIVLAGFLQHVPDNLISAFDHRIINIHPALLPKYGGKGMYGCHVHEAVKANGDTETGMTIHWVNNIMDGGAIISQFTTKVAPSDTVEDITHKVHLLEMEHFPREIERILSELDL